VPEAVAEADVAALVRFGDEGHEHVRRPAVAPAALRHLGADGVVGDGEVGATRRHRLSRERREKVADEEQMLLPAGFAGAVRVRVACRALEDAHTAELVATAGERVDERDRHRPHRHADEITIAHQGGRGVGGDPLVGERSQRVHAAR
jgi:hypothetical protein